jgi:hypothetical protein
MTRQELHLEITGICVKLSSIKRSTHPSVGTPADGV